MEDEDPFGMGAPPLSEPSAEESFEAPPMEASAFESFDVSPPADMGSFGATPLDEPADMGSFEPPADVGSFEPPADMGSFEPPADMGSFEPPQMNAPIDMGMEGMGDMGGMGSTFEAPAVPSFGGDDVGMQMNGGLSGDAFMSPPGGELGPVAKWRIEQQEKLSAKAAAAAEAEAAKIAQAQDALQQFYAERSEMIAKRAAANRDEEAQYVSDRDAAMVADSWDSVCKLVDLKEKANATVDTSRMRSLLTQLKHV